MTYSEKLLATKKGYFFDEWKEMFFGDEGEDDGMEQYTEENCNAAQNIMDELIAGLINLGGDASETQKINLFQKAVESYNILNNSCEEPLIETMERDQLGVLFKNIAVVSGINLKNFEYEDITLKWREW